MDILTTPLEEFDAYARLPEVDACEDFLGTVDHAHMALQTLLVDMVKAGDNPSQNQKLVFVDRYNTINQLMHYHLPKVDAADFTQFTEAAEAAVNKTNTDNQKPGVIKRIAQAIMDFFTRWFTSLGRLKAQIESLEKIYNEEKSSITLPIGTPLKGEERLYLEKKYTDGIGDGAALLNDIAKKVTPVLTRSQSAANVISAYNRVTSSFESTLKRFPKASSSDIAKAKLKASGKATVIIMPTKRLYMAYKGLTNNKATESYIIVPDNVIADKNIKDDTVAIRDPANLLKEAKGFINMAEEVTKSVGDLAKAMTRLNSASGDLLRLQQAEVSKMNRSARVCAGEAQKAATIRAKAVQSILNTAIKTKGK